MSRECTFPWTGMVIDPQGYITVCCNYTDRKALGHISTVNNLEDFFLEDEYTALRYKFKDGWRKNPNCILCLKKDQEIQTPIYHSLTFNAYGAGLQYLELTTSNTCNQTCATCSSYFSSKWNKINSIFDLPTTKSYSLTENNINTIINALPNLKEIQIKGGEPFADMKNLKIIKALGEVNPKCDLIICSNFQLIPKTFIVELKKMSSVMLAASIDAIGSKFDWIRGGNFDTAIKNLKMVYDELGVISDINPCVSVYNIKHLRETYDYFENVSYAKLSKIYNVVEYPNHLSPANIFDQDELDSIVQSQFDDIRNDVDVNALYMIKAKRVDSLFSEYELFTKRMNGVRGFSILEDI